MKEKILTLTCREKLLHPYHNIRRKIQRERNDELIDILIFEKEKNGRDLISMLQKKILLYNSYLFKGYNIKLQTDFEYLWLEREDMIVQFLFLMEYCRKRFENKMFILWKQYKTESLNVNVRAFNTINCSVCLEENVLGKKLFYPCRHCTCCEECSKAFKVGNKCPVCREWIRNIFNVHTYRQLPLSQRKQIFFT